MNERILRRLFPNASDSTVAVNCEIHPAQPVEQAMALDKKAKGKTPSILRPLVCFTRCGTRLLDADGLARSFKDLQDGLRFARLIRDDSPKEIRAHYTQRLLHKNEQEHTLIEIYYP